MYRNILLAGLYFLLSTVLTWWFIEAGAKWYHFDMGKMMLSCAVAGDKWGLQLLCAFLLLKYERWAFIRRIGFTCFAGSCVLLPFCLGLPATIAGANSFMLSLILSVCTMLALYYYSVRKSGVSLRWYFLWLACLCVAVLLQLTIVFDIWS